MADLARPGISWVNRQSGSGTRVWLDVQLKRAGVDPAVISGYEREETTHMGVARTVAEGRATAGLGIQAAATAYGLEFVRLGEERYDLVVPREHWGEETFEALRAVVGSSPFQQALLALGGYEVSHTGEETRLQ